MVTWLARHYDALVLKVVCLSTTKIGIDCRVQNKSFLANAECDNIVVMRSKWLLWNIILRCNHAYIRVTKPQYLNVYFGLFVFQRHGLRCICLLFQCLHSVPTPLPWFASQHQPLSPADQSFGTWIVQSEDAAPLSPRVSILVEPGYCRASSFFFIHHGKNLH